MKTWEFTKGHGTCNDFVILVDRTNLIEMSDEDVRFLCNRRAGIGADGILRAVQAAHMPEWDGPGDIWFMDYRNADGSIAEMCGNGLRVFVRYLTDEGLAPLEPIDIATRSGLRRAWPSMDGHVKVSMGKPEITTTNSVVKLADRDFAANGVDVGNPHAVVFLDSEDELNALDLSRAPEFDHDDFPGGVNVEFVLPLENDRLSMRVYERGVGETMSCGTGIVASATAWRHAHPSTEPVEVQVVGGLTRVELTPEQAYLEGPTQIVAHGTVEVPDWD